MQTPQLTDTDALTRNRNRAMASGAAALFLQDDVITEVKERLTEVNRSFTAPAVVTAFPDLWRAALPEAVIVGDEELLALEPGAHDLVIHALALHWANDPVGQLIQCRRALKPDGLFIGALFGGQTIHELRASLAEAEATVSGGLSPRVLPMAEIRDLGALLQRSGFALPVADAVTKRVLYRDALHLMRDLRAMGEGNALTSRHRRPMRRALLDETQRRYAESYQAEDDRVSATFETIFLTGWAPHSDQQQPLRPGSAEKRLSEALGAPEIALPAAKGEG